MKEFDFEELDRAVNSLISPAAAPTDSPAPVNFDVDKNTTPEISQNSVSTPSPEFTPTSPTPAPFTSVPPRSIVERRQSGRFMDVVHPSSDMKTATNSAPTRSRDEIKVAPRGEESVSPPAQSTTDSAWPDPIDYDASKEPDRSTVPANTTESAKVEVEPELTPELTVDESLNAVSGPNSPFLPDAKVEKRPLGAFSGEHHDDTPVPTEAPVESMESTDSNSEQGDGKSVDDQTLGPIGHDEMDTPLPAELQENLLSIESDSTTPSVSNAPTRDEEPVGPTSITQQYTATPSTNKDKPGEIYDTKAYHKALKSPAKKKSSWWLVVWIVLLLVVGAGAGAAIYYFVLPAL